MESGLKEKEARATAEASGRDSAAFGPVLRALYEAVLISDLQGRLIDANPRAVRSLGGAHASILKRNVTEIIAGFDAEVMARVEQNLSEGRFTVLDAYCTREDGRTFPAEIAISRLRLGGTEHLAFSLRNMEWRERTLERLRTGYNALHNAAAGMVIADRQAKIVYTNPAFSRLWKAGAEKEWAGQNVAGMWTDGAQARAMVDAAAAGEIWEGELEGRTANGARFHVQANAAPNRMADGTPVGLVFSFIDISERKRAEEAIRKEAEAQIQKAREQDDFSGLLNILSIPDVVQLIDASQKSGWLAILDPDMKPIARIGFEEGRVVLAECGPARGEEGFYAAIARGGHAFVFEQGKPDKADPSIASSTMGLLLEGSRRMDEQAEAASEVPPATGGGRDVVCQFCQAGSATQGRLLWTGFVWEDHQLAGDP